MQPEHMVFIQLSNSDCSLRTNREDMDYFGKLISKYHGGIMPSASY